MLFEWFLPFAVVELWAQRSRPNDKLENVTQALHRLRQLHRFQRAVLHALPQDDEQLVVGQRRVEVLVDVKLQHRYELLVPVQINNHNLNAFSVQENKTFPISR